MHGLFFGMGGYSTMTLKNIRNDASSEIRTVLPQAESDCAAVDVLDFGFYSASLR